VEPCQPGCHRGKREPSRFETTLRLHSFETAQAVARARWRRCSAFSLALRLLARIVALASSMRLQSGWDQAILPGTGLSTVGLAAVKGRDQSLSLIGT
jgi:hypothetical protein